MDNRLFLKIKLKSLAAEAGIIKREEQKRKVPRFRSNQKLHQNVVPDDIKDAARRIRDAYRARAAQRRAKDWYPKTEQEMQELRLHRIHVVRKEARLTGIAYAFIRGREFSTVDSGIGLTADDWKRVEKMVARYGNKELPFKPTWAPVPTEYFYVTMPGIVYGVTSATALPASTGQ